MQYHSFCSQIKSHRIKKYEEFTNESKQTEVLQWELRKF